MNSVAEERPLPEDHTERSRLGRDAHAFGVPTDVEHRDIAGPRRGRVDDPAGTGVNAVGPDQEVSFGFGSVLEPRRDAAVRYGLSIHQPFAVLDAGTAPDRLVTQRPVEVGALEGLADHALGESSAVGHVTEVFAGAALDRHTRRGEALGQHEVVGVDGAQGVQAVAGEGQESAGVVRTASVRFVDDRVYSGAPERHRGHRSGDAPADNEDLLRASHAPFFLGAKMRQSLSVSAQIRNVAGLPPMGRTRLLWNAAKRQSVPSRTATS